MKVEVTCFGVLREYLPANSVGNRVTLDLRESATAADVIAALGAPRRLVFSLLVDGARSTPDKELQDGAEVTLMPAFSGGSLG